MLYKSVSSPGGEPKKLLPQKYINEAIDFFELVVTAHIVASCLHCFGRIRCVPTHSVKVSNWLVACREICWCYCWIYVVVHETCQLLHQSVILRQVGIAACVASVHWYRCPGRGEHVYCNGYLHINRHQQFQPMAPDGIGQMTGCCLSKYVMQYVKAMVFVS